MLYLIVQNKDIYPFSFDTRADFKHFCEEWNMLSEYDIMIIELDFQDANRIVKPEIIWRAGEGWLYDL